MGKRRHSVESIVAMLREADVLLAKGQPLLEIVRQFGISDVTYYKWQKEYGGFRVDQAKRFEQLEGVFDSKAVYFSKSRDRHPPSFHPRCFNETAAIPVLCA